MNYDLEHVTGFPELWKDRDPVRPELDVSFKTAPGRSVYGLYGDDGDWKAFMCCARTSCIPKSVEDLAIHTCPAGSYIIPYTVWSHEKGAGRVIINKILSMLEHNDIGVNRVVTLSPLTTMAERFHLRNGAEVIRTNATTINFEYKINNDSQD